MSWYYSDWSWLQQLIAMATAGVLALAVVTGIVAWVHSHRHGAPGHVVTTDRFADRLLARRHRGPRAA